MFEIYSIHCLSRWVAEVHFIIHILEGEDNTQALCP